MKEATAGAMESPGAQLAFKPGLIERALLQGRALALSDPLLESDTEPEKLFRTMERSYSGDLFAIGAMSLWCAGFLLCFVAIARRVWFARSMTVYLLIPSALALLLTLFAVRQRCRQTVSFLTTTCSWPSWNSCSYFPRWQLFSFLCVSQTRERHSLTTCKPGANPGPVLSADFPGP